MQTAVSRANQMASEIQFSEFDEDKFMIMMMLCAKQPVGRYYNSLCVVSKAMHQHKNLEEALENFIDNERDVCSGYSIEELRLAWELTC